MSDGRKCARDRRRRVVALAIVALLLSLHLEAAAQQQQQMVPLELMETLSLNIYGVDDEEPAILVGALPPAFVEAVPIPDNARIIGSIVHGNSSRSSLAVPGEPEMVRRDLEARLTAAGWQKFEPPEYGGFVNRAMPPGLQFCLGDSMSVSAATLENPRGGTYVVMMHAQRLRASLCNREEHYMVERRYRTMLPALRPPAGARMTGGGSGGSGDDWRATARIETTESVNDVADHFDAQLRERDWTPLERVATDAVAMRTYRVADEDGREWYGVLTVAAPSSAAQHIVSLTVTLLADEER